LNQQAKFHRRKISRDEFCAFHPPQVSTKRELEIVDALKLKESLSLRSLPVSLEECKVDDTVLEFVADRLLVELGCDREYNTANPLILWI
jgi:hypothetical protein